MNSYAPIHLTQICAGFELLRKQGKLRYTFRRENPSPTLGRPHFGHSAYLYAADEDGTATVFDTHDKGWLQLPPADFDADMETLNVRAYCRRSYRPELYTESKYALLQKPLGLNYHVSCPHNPYLQMSLRDWREANEPWRKHTLHRKLVSLMPPVPRFGLYSDALFYPNAFTQPPDHETDGTVLFLCRNWFPLGEDPNVSADLPVEKQVELQIAHNPALETIYNMDLNRAALIRALRDTYGPKAIAGMTDTAFSRLLFPDLIERGTILQRSNFLAAIKKADVCLATIGLHQSTGWKFAEYVAAAKAIVSEHPYYTTVGDFSAGQNYLGFASLEEAMHLVESLLLNPQKRFAMQAANSAYYQAFMAPDVLVARALELSLV
jgi:hypothetical protein